MMRKLYQIGIAFLCAATFTVQANNKPVLLNKKLPAVKHNKPTLRTLDNQGQFELQKLSDDFSPLTNGKTTNHSPLRVAEQTDETAVLLDSIVSKNSDGTVDSKTIYGYNAQGVRISQSYESATQKYDYTYNANGERTLYQSYSLNSESGTWYVSYKEETEWGVDAEGNKTAVQITSSYNHEAQSLKYSQKEEAAFQGNTNIYLYSITYTYTETGAWKPVSKLEQPIQGDDGYDPIIANYTWNADANAWQGTSKYGFLSYPDGSYLQATYTWNSNAWDWTSKTETEYDTSGNKISEAQYAKSGNAWQPISKTGWEGEYSVHYDLVGSEFVKTYKDRTWYNANGNLYSYERYDWDAENTRWYFSKNIGLCDWDNLSGEWRVTGYIELGYDKAGHELYRIQLVRDDSQSEWMQSYTYKQENIYDENGRQTSRVSYAWSGGEPTVVEKSFVLGNFTATATNYSNTVQSWTVSLFPDASDVNKVWISNLVLNGTNLQVYGILNDDKTELKIPVGQAIAETADYYAYLEGYYGPTGETEIPTDGFITCTIDEDGNIHVQDEFYSAAYNKEDGTLAGYYNGFWSGAVLVADNPKIEYKWNLNQWVNNRKSDYIYNATGNQEFTITYNWINNAWQETSRATYYYSEHDVTSSNAPAYELKIQAYPNPAKDFAVISGAAGKLLTIHDNTGKKVLEQAIASDTENISLSSLLKGIYIFKVENFTGKFIKE